jgi:hypothetical protein
MIGKSQLRQKSLRAIPITIFLKIIEPEKGVDFFSLLSCGDAVFNPKFHKGRILEIASLTLAMTGSIRLFKYPCEIWGNINQIKEETNGR